MRYEGFTGTTLLWRRRQRPANREQEDGVLVLCVGRKEVNHVIIEESQAGCAEALSIRGQVHPTSDGARLQLHRPVAAVPVSLQQAFQICEKEDVNTGVCRQFLF